MTFQWKSTPEAHHMGNLFTVRLEDKDKEVMNFSSKLSRMPVSKVINPFLKEGARSALGAALLFQIDRSTIVQKQMYRNFLDLIVDPIRLTPGMSDEGSFEEMFKCTPRIVWDFFDLIKEAKVRQKLSAVMKDIEFREEIDFIDTRSLRYISHQLGDIYVTMGGSLSRMDYHLATKTFFHIMLHSYYRNNASGTSKALSSQWYTHQDTVSKIEDELIERYERKVSTKVVEAIEVPVESKIRKPPEAEVLALPPSEQVVAKVIAERKKKKIKRSK
ncbi:MAG: hypothetical protein ACMUIG_01195 [Thermoplasmatota archaeon]